MNTLERMLLRLPDVYSHDTNSNLGKLLALPSDEITEIQDTLGKVLLGRQIDEAEGETLDLLGRDLGEPRSGRNDEVYRQYLAVAVIRIFSRGEPGRLNEASQILLGDAFLGIREAWNDDGYDNEPAAVIARYRPAKEQDYYLDVLRQIVAQGIRVYGEVESDSLICGTFNAGDTDFTRTTTYTAVE